MPNPFGKTRPVDQPYAIYEAPFGIQWRILKTYKMVKNEGAYARWMVAAYSDATGAGGDMGDTYAIEVKRYGRLVAADPAWQEAYDTRPVATVAAYLGKVEA